MEMGSGDACDTGLALGLNYNGSGHGETIVKLERSSSNMVPVEPTLTLALSDDTHGSIKLKEEAIRVVAGRQLSPHSTVSSFSDGHPSSHAKNKENSSSMKSEEADEKVSFRVSDEELEEGSARKKLRLTKDQSALLEDKFKEQSTLNPKQKQALAKQLNLRPRQVEVWFQNRRARTKLKQTEIDCEVLKRYCETLSDENRRLQKEVHELRALRFASPVYMQFPAAALTMCPSCKKITTGSEGSKAAATFVTAPKHEPHGLFMNPFTHSAAC